MKNSKLLLKVGVLTSILLLTACGQKGPLYLEEEKDKKTVGTTEQSVSESNTSNDEEEN